MEPLCKAVLFNDAAGDRFFLLGSHVSSIQVLRQFSPIVAVLGKFFRLSSDLSSMKVAMHLSSSMVAGDSFVHLDRDIGCIQLTATSPAFVLR